MSLPGPGSEQLGAAAPAAYVISSEDSVATALETIPAGRALLRGARCETLVAVQEIPRGHKIALAAHAVGDPVVKYGIVIGRATAAISPGSWVHLQSMESLYDERSSSLDPETGAPTNIQYS